MPNDLQVGLFLNTGEFPGMTHDEIYDQTLAEIDLAEALGYDDAWVTEHHFIPFGINSNALAAAAFLLGRTKRMRIGTAVTLAPQYHPIQLAEQAAILDQMSGGRFDFGIGRGGYVREFEVFGTDTARWDAEVGETARVLLDAWTADEVASDSPHTGFTAVRVNPRPRTRPHPPLYLASSSPQGLEFAASNGLPAMHYFGAPLEGRLKTGAAYTEYARKHGRDPLPVPHLHTMVSLVTGDESAARARLLDNLVYSYMTGDWPAVPQAGDRHSGPDGKPIDRESFAKVAVDIAFVGSARSVTEQIEAYVNETGARHIALFMEPIADSGAIEASIRAFAADVRPRLDSLTFAPQEPSLG